MSSSFKAKDCDVWVSREDMRNTLRREGWVQKEDQRWHHFGAKKSGLTLLEAFSVIL